MGAPVDRAAAETRLRKRKSANQRTDKKKREYKMKDTEKQRESVKIKNRLSDILQQPSVIQVMHGNMRQDRGGE